MKRSTQYIPPYQLEEQLRKQAEIIFEKCVLFAKSEIALNFLKAGIDIIIISESTGLSIEEIEALGSEEE